MEDEQEDEPAYDDPGQQAEMCHFRLRNLVHVDSTPKRHFTEIRRIYYDLWFMIYTDLIHPESE